MALDKGAQAVIFDVSDDADAAAEVSVKDWPEMNRTITSTLICGSLLVLNPIQLRETDSLPRPVVLVEADDAEELMGLVNKNEEAIVRILVNPPRWVIHTHQHRIRTLRVDASPLHLPL